MYLTLEETKKYFNVKDDRTITHKFIKQGLRHIRIGKQYRFDLKDIQDFAEKLKDTEEEKNIKLIPRKRKSKTLNIDYEKIRINRQLNRVV